MACLLDKLPHNVHVTVLVAAEMAFVMPQLSDDAASGVNSMGAGVWPAARSEQELETQEQSSPELKQLLLQDNDRPHALSGTALTQMSFVMPARSSFVIDCMQAAGIVELDCSSSSRSRGPCSVQLSRNCRSLHKMLEAAPSLNAAPFGSHGINQLCGQPHGSSQPSCYGNSEAEMAVSCSPQQK